ERVGDELPVLMQRRGREAARHAILVGAEPELELDLDRGPTLRAEPADRVLVARHRLRAVDRPGERFQERRLAGTVGPDDARDPGRARWRATRRTRAAARPGRRSAASPRPPRWRCARPAPWA